MNRLQEEAEKILQVYAVNKNLDILKKAKKVFVDKTGTIDEDSDEYESRMSSFNDWYLFQYQYSTDTSVIQDYAKKNETELVSSLLKTSYSVFLFHKINFKKQIVVKDILHGTKHILAKDNGHLALVEDDIFIGRICEHENQFYLLNGLCLLPREILSPLKKACKKIRKTKTVEESEFLLNLERLKTKSTQYAHIDPVQIFTF